VAVCATCAKDNPAGAKFCNECGTPVSVAAEVREERKVVSVLFCDLVGFTQTSERQDPEDVRARLRPYHSRVRQEIERNGGTVEKFVGDAVMAVFGAPIAHEDDAERAVRSALRVLSAIQGLNESDESLGLSVRIGVNTGEAVVAVGAQAERGEGLVAGDVVNTAARIQQVARPNGVAVSEQTHRATAQVFEYERLPAAAAKGKAELLQLWRPTAVRNRTGRDAGDYRTRFVGRGIEKSLLIGIFERASQQRTPQLVTIVGEPGVGKSRLAAELFGYIDAKPDLIRWRQGRCLPYGEGITFWALSAIVKVEAGILDSDSPEVAARKLDSVVAPDDPDRQWLLQRLRPLVGVEAASPAERQELFTAWRRLLESWAAARSTILLVEDLHWADEALLEFLEYLAEWSQGVPLLVVCTARPELYERRANWGAGQRNAHTIDLPPLSSVETAELVSNLAGAAALPSDLERSILERAGGNPLYAEEFVRLLADRGLDTDEATLPDSVHALIAARLDTLSSDRKSLLQDAAVVGKVFWAGAVAEIGGREPREVDLALHELVRKELVRPMRATSMEGESEYAFWHLLVRDVAYSQIPRAERVRRHRAAASWIERKAGERVEDLAEVLAHHYLQALELAQAAGDTGQAGELAIPARRFLALAGERTLGLDASQAEARLARALGLTPADDPFRPELLVRWAEAAFQAGSLNAAVEAMEEALSVLRARGELETTARALQLGSRIALRRGRGEQVALAAEAVSLLEREAPGAPLVEAYTQLANAYSVSGSFGEGIVAADRAAALAEELGLPEPPRALGYKGYNRASLGEDDGLTEMERAIALLVERGAGRDAAIHQNNLAIARYPLQGPQRSLEDFELAIAFARERGLGESAALLEANRPGLLVELGRPDEALELAARLAAGYAASGDGHSLAEVRSVEIAVRYAREDPDSRGDAEWLAEAGPATGTADVSVMALGCAASVTVSDPGRARALLVALDRLDGGRETPYYARQLAAIVRVALAVGDRELAGRLAHGLEPRHPLNEHALCAVEAELTEADGGLERAAVRFAEAATRWRRFGNVPEGAYALLGHGRCLVALGTDGAEEALREARGVFESLGYVRAMRETEPLLASAGAPI
jgi:class 3 adenylate cyclase/tetratricopeptide (TPR) repeat protein